MKFAAPSRLYWANRPAMRVVQALLTGEQYHALAAALDDLAARRDSNGNEMHNAAGSQRYVSSHSQGCAVASARVCNGMK